MGSGSSSGCADKADFSPPNGTVEILSTAQGASFTFLVSRDAPAEVAEQFVVELTGVEGINPGASVDTSRAARAYEIAEHDDPRGIIVVGQVRPHSTLPGWRRTHPA